MKCFYHVDADGKCSAYWVRMACENRNIKWEKNDFYKINYGMSFPIEIIKQDELVFIVDYSIQPDEMLELLNITSNVIWIDHHITAIEKYENFPYKIQGIRKNGTAACMLTYCYFKMVDENFKPIKKNIFTYITDIPYFTRLLADWDVWEFFYGEDTSLFQAGFNLNTFEPWEEEWDNLCNNEQEYIDKGKIVLQYRDNYAKSYCKAKGFATEFEGYKVYAMNIGLINSEWFKSVNTEEYDFVMPFSYNGKEKKWNYSMYTIKEDIDVAKIATKYGGGGHKQAAGFNHEMLLVK